MIQKWQKSCRNTTKHNWTYFTKLKTQIIVNLCIWLNSKNCTQLMCLKTSQMCDTFWMLHKACLVVISNTKYGTNICHIRTCVHWFIFHSSFRVMFMQAIRIDFSDVISNCSNNWPKSQMQNALEYFSSEHELATNSNIYTLRSLVRHPVAVILYPTFLASWVWKRYAWLHLRTQTLWLRVYACA